MNMFRDKSRLKEDFKEGRKKEKRRTKREDPRLKIAHTGWIQDRR